MHRGVQEWLSAFLVLCYTVYVGSSPLSSVASVVSKVGLPAVLPCAVTSQPDSSGTPLIQWQTSSDSVLERMGEELFQGDAYRGRADVPEEMLRAGNCSLLLKDVRFTDTGMYESFLLLGESDSKNRVLIQSVQLTVIDHKNIVSVEIGGDLHLDLYTNQAEQMIFQNSSESDWSVLWKRHRSANMNAFVKKNKKLTFSGVTSSNAGMYKVLDAEGLALSSVKVTVTEPGASMQRVFQQHATSGEATLGKTSLSLILLLLSGLLSQMT